MRSFKVLEGKKLAFGPFTSNEELDAAQKIVFPDMMPYNMEDDVIYAFYKTRDGFRSWSSHKNEKDFLDYIKKRTAETNVEYLLVRPEEVLNLNTDSYEIF